ncbi:MAG: gfo/Idh/MocA family oxidoreductase [Streptosporangiales bacterium]|nr:gfo/Idh/MocA family oxidoreductase [Streptosporangiales bacterium]
MSAGRRVVLLGAGLAAAPHLSALAALGCDVVAVATSSAERLAGVHGRFPDAKAYDSAEEAVAEAVRVGADLALVLTPPNSHLEMVRLAAEGGLDVVVEKPLDVSVARAADLVRVAEDAGIKLAVCYQHRAKPAARALRDALDRETLGRIAAAQVNVPWWRAQSYYDQPGRGTFDRDGGGVLITQAVHILDLLVWYLGAPRRIAASAGRSGAHSTEVETLVGALLDYGEGRFAALFAATAAYPGSDEQVLLVGDRGSATLTGANLAVQAADGSPPRMVTDRERAGGVADPAAIPWEWHRDLLAEAFDAFDAGREPLAGGASALATQRVVAGIYRAARTGAWVALDDPALDADPRGERPW